jgi:hypothetical protein
MILTVFGLTSTLFNFISNSIINPEKNEVENGFYPKCVGENVPQYFLLVICLFSGLSVISVLLLFPYNESEEGHYIKKLEYLQVRYTI